MCMYIYKKNWGDGNDEYKGIEPRGNIFLKNFINRHKKRMETRVGLREI